MVISKHSKRTKSHFISLFRDQTHIDRRQRFLGSRTNLSVKSQTVLYQKHHFHGGASTPCLVRRPFRRHELQSGRLLKLFDARFEALLEVHIWNLTIFFSQFLSKKRFQNQKLNFEPWLAWIGRKLTSWLRHPFWILCLKVLLDQNRQKWKHSRLSQKLKLAKINQWFQTCKGCKADQFVVGGQIVPTLSVFVIKFHSTGAIFTKGCQTDLWKTNFR